MSQGPTNQGKREERISDKDVFAAGLELRRHMFGVAGADQQIERQDAKHVHSGIAHRAR